MHIPKQFDIIPQVTSKKDKVTENIIKSLLTLTFEDDIVRKNEYIKSQEDEEKLFNEVKELSKKIPLFVKNKNRAISSEKVISTKSKTIIRN
nr:aromatic motif membrane protein [Mycoplasmopsis bovis]